MISTEKFTHDVNQAFDTLLNFALDMDKHYGKEDVNVRLHNAVTIYAKIACHASSLRILTPADLNTPGLAWDFGSACAIARCIIESQEALFYYCIEGMAEEERDFRWLLGRLHDAEHRIKIMTYVDPEASKDDLVATAVDLKNKLQISKYYSALKPRYREEIKRGNTPQYIQSAEERCKAAGLSFAHYRQCTMFLSQSVHTTPMAINQWRNFVAGAEGPRKLMSAPVENAFPFFAVASHNIAALFKVPANQVSNEVRRAIQLGQYLATADYISIR